MRKESESVVVHEKEIIGHSLKLNVTKRDQASDLLLEERSVELYGSSVEEISDLLDMAMKNVKELRE
jgi:hypothetical protein